MVKKRMSRIVVLTGLIAIAVMFSTIMAGGATSAGDTYWQSGELCEPARDTLQSTGLTDDGDTNWTAQSGEYDPLKRHSCGDLRDDIQEEVYNTTFEVVDEPYYWGCDSTYTPWNTCVGVNIEGCDLWVGWLGWTCVGGIFPEDET